MRPKKTSSAPGVVVLLIVLGVAAVIFALATKKPKSAVQHAPVPEQPTQEVAPESAAPSPKPAPAPVITPKPAPVPEPEVAIEPEPTPEADAPELPKFDVTGFFERAQKIMIQRAAPMIAKRDRSLADNCLNLEGSLQRAIRNITSLSDRNEANELARSFLQEAREDGNRIADYLDPDLADIGSIEKLHQEALKRQAAIDDSLLQELAQLSKVYILGLKKQIERLQSEDDPAAIALIEQEIETTRSDEEHFPNLMLGIKPSDDGWQDE